MAALQAYRSLLRATRLTFQGDERLLAGARDQIRAGFREKASLSPSDPAVAPAVEHAQQVAALLRENVVQGKNEGDGRYKLRIHEHTERGDNDTIKTAAGQTVKVGGVGCCSS
ncbi:hypothetical protein KVR01_009099 [Diaporthe batatas]|uniref:uncharacterized protein n=1 Tax=Diaporthe batatas TaxID=748121 RepID=UPI001D057F40|nr:uncharacterized protein KVR01_009099 [Diaporthe batatas]KAG8160835.1 hypothetical protein KVR01_009099 [Diaporthe batatas]